MKAAVTQFETGKGEYGVTGLIEYAMGKYDVTGSELAIELAFNPKAKERSPVGRLSGH